MPSDQQLKRKESDAELFPSPSPKKKQASSALDLPSTKILDKSGVREGLPKYTPIVSAPPLKFTLAFFLNCKL